MSGTMTFISTLVCIAAILVIARITLHHES